MQKPPEATRLVSWYEPSKEMAEELHSVNGILIDSFIITAAQIARMERLNGRIAFIDDFHHRIYRRGWVIDWTVGAEQLAFPKRTSKVTYLLGPGYCALRPEFRRPLPKPLSRNPQSIFVSFGGSDIRHLTEPVLETLQKNFPDLIKNVVIGSGFQANRIDRKLQRKNIFFHCAQTAFQMQALMAQSNLAICGGGQTLYELASQGVPPVAICTIDNQRLDIEGFAQAGFAISAGDWEKPGLLDAIVRGVHELWPAAARASRSAAGRALVDGEGGTRLAAALIGGWSEPTNCSRQ